MKLIEIEGRYVIPDLKYFLITGSEELNLLPNCAPGSIAYTAGVKQMWQLSEAGEWIEV